MADRAIVPLGSASAVMLSRTSRSTDSSIEQTTRRHQDMEIRRNDREQHHHKQVWTKAAHGGPYRKCSTERDPAAVTPEPGYERPKSGPTTNFVGNHMTQGAIDLVQMDLSIQDPAADYARLRDYCRRFRPPRLLSKAKAVPLLSSGGSLTSMQPQLEPVSQYSWTDAEGFIELRVPLQADEEISCTFAKWEVKVLIDGQEKTRALHSGHLYADIKPAKCSWHITRQDTADSCSPAKRLLAPFSKCVPEGLQLDSQEQMGMCDGRAVIVRLVKKRANQSWPELRKNAEATTQRTQSHPLQQDAASLAALRRSLISQRANKVPGDGLLYNAVDTNAAKNCSDNDRDGKSAKDPAESWGSAEEAAQAGTLQLHNGAYDAAVCSLTAAMRLTTASEMVPEYLLMRAECHESLGQLKKAIKDCSSALEALPSNVPLAAATAAHLRRGRLLELLERFAASAVDYKAALELDPGCKQASAALARVAQFIHQARKGTGSSSRQQTIGRSSISPVLRPSPLAC